MAETETLVSSLPSAPEKGRLLTYGGKVDESLMNMLREAQMSAGIKRFADFMQDMLFRFTGKISRKQNPRNYL